MNAVRLALTAALTLVLAGVAAPAAAQQPVLSSRLSSVVGNFLVGYATVGDGGSFSETLRTLDAAYGQTQADSGSVNGFQGTTPVVAAGSYAVEQHYNITPTLISAWGSGETSASTPFGYVSVGSRSISQLRLVFSVAVPTPYVLTGEVLHAVGDPVQGLGSSALATARLSGAGAGGLWRSDSSPGTFSNSGTFMPGFSYTLEGLADSTLNANAHFVMNLALSPVPEPAQAALLSLGLALLAACKRSGHG